MANSITPNGKKISALIANDEIKDFLDMMTPTRPLVVNFCQEQLQEKNLLPLRQESPNSNAATFFAKDVNAFVFDKDLVTRFFDTEGPNGIQKPADVLLVFLGMVKDDNNNPNNVGTPTVVLTGCHLQQDGTFKSMDLPGEEATEYPPKKIIRVFPQRLDEMISIISEDKKNLANDFKAEIHKHLPLTFKIVE